MQYTKNMVTLQQKNTACHAGGREVSSRPPLPAGVMKITKAG